MNNKPTRAEVLAGYLGLNERTHSACYSFCKACNGLGSIRKMNFSYDAERLTERAVCGRCKGEGHTLALPDPLAPGTEADAWLGVLVRTKDFWTIHAFTDGFGANVFREGWRSPFYGKATDPTPAIVRAMMAADPAFAAKMEGAEG